MSHAMMMRYPTHDGVGTKPFSVSVVLPEKVYKKYYRSPVKLDEC